MLDFVGRKTNLTRTGPELGNERRGELVGTVSGVREHSAGLTRVLIDMGVIERVCEDNGADLGVKARAR